MRKLLLLLPACMFVISGFCQQVGSDEALLAARNRIVSDGMEQYSVGDIHAVCYDGTVTGWMVSLSPQGYFAFSANRELPPLIAYSYTNNADMEGRLEALLSTDLAYRLENRLELPAEIITERKTAWNNLLNPEKQKRDVKTQQWPTPGTTSTGGWLETNWTQNAPYNNMCPFDPVTSTRSIAGCPAVAMGMIVNYHETTNGVFFDDGDDYYHNYAGRQYWIDDDYFTIKFPPFPDLNQYLDTLQEHYDAHLAPTNQDMAAIVFACGVAATQVYTSSGSGTFSVNQAFQAYQKFNFTHAELLFDTDTNIYNRIIQNIIDSLPVHLAVVDPSWSSGHNVVIDGYNTDNYYHLNFGWGGASNGWYLLPDGIPYSLTVIEGVIVDIYPDQSTSAGTVSTCDFSIWPNPAYNRVNVSLSGINGHGKLLLTDIRGIPVLEREFSIRKENIQLNIEGIPAGVYLLNLHTEKDNKAVKLIVY